MKEYNTIKTKFRIDELRRKQGLKVLEFIAECGVSKTFYYDVIKRKRNCSVAFLEKVAFILDCKVWDLFDKE